MQLIKFLIATSIDFIYNSVNKKLYKYDTSKNTIYSGGEYYSGDDRYLKDIAVNLGQIISATIDNTVTFYRRSSTYTNEGKGILLSVKYNDVIYTLQKIKITTEEITTEIDVYKNGNDILFYDSGDTFGMPEGFSIDGTNGSIVMNDNKILNVIVDGVTYTYDSDIKGYKKGDGSILDTSISIAINGLSYTTPSGYLYNTDNQLYKTDTNQLVSKIKFGTTTYTYDSASKYYKHGNDILFYNSGLTFTIPASFTISNTSGLEGQIIKDANKILNVIVNGIVYEYDAFKTSYIFVDQSNSSNSIILFTKMSCASSSYIITGMPTSMDSATYQYMQDNKRIENVLFVDSNDNYYVTIENTQHKLPTTRLYTWNTTNEEYEYTYTTSGKSKTIILSSFKWFDNQIIIGNDSNNAFKNDFDIKLSQPKMYYIQDNSGKIIDKTFIAPSRYDIFFKNNSTIIATFTRASISELSTNDNESFSGYLGSFSGENSNYIDGNDDNKANMLLIDNNDDTWYYYYSILRFRINTQTLPINITTNDDNNIYIYSSIIEKYIQYNNDSADLNNNYFATPLLMPSLTRVTNYANGNIYYWNNSALKFITFDGSGDIQFLDNNNVSST